MSDIDKQANSLRKMQSEGSQSIHKEALERFEEVWNLEKDQRTKAIEDSLFVNAEDGQWEEEAIEKRRDRPRYTIDRISPAIEQINGDQRQNRTQIKVRPSDGGNKEVAKIQTGLIRQIESESDASSIYDNAHDEISTGGYGGWGYLTQFSSEDTFKQEIVMRPIKSAASTLFLDPSAKKFDKRDGMYGFLIEDITTENFKRAYPDATIQDFSDMIYSQGSCGLWFNNNRVRVAEYWRVKLVDTEIALLSDGRVIDMKEEESVIDELAEKGITILETRKTKKREVVSYLMSGAEVLKGPMPWAGKYIPLVGIYGRTANVQGKEYVRGVVRKAKDANRIYNYVTSTVVEATAMTPKDPIWITSKQAAGHGPALKSFNTQNSPFMIYETDPQSPGIPQRGGAPAVQQALIQQQNQASLDVQSATGVSPPSLGMNPELQSGKAIIAQQKMGDRGSFVFGDNLRKGQKFGGDILIDLMPRIMDTQQVVTILNFDGTTEDIEINAEGLDEFNQVIVDESTGEPVIVNDLSQGKYETSIETGPSFSTQREESVQQLIDLANASPLFAEVTPDLIAKSLTALESEELFERMRKIMIEKGIAEPTDEEKEKLGLDQPKQPSEEQVALLDNIKMQTAQMMADIENKNADTDGKDAKTLQTKLQAQKVAVDAYNTLIEAYEKQITLGIPFGIDEHQIRTAQAGILSLSQDELVKDAVNSQEGLI